MPVRKEAGAAAARSEPRESVATGGGGGLEALLQQDPNLRRMSADVKAAVSRSVGSVQQLKTMDKDQLRALGLKIGERLGSGGGYSTSHIGNANQYATAYSRYGEADARFLVPQYTYA